MSPREAVPSAGSSFHVAVEIKDWGMRRLAFWTSLTIPVLAVVWGVWRGTFPLGVAGEPVEWVWNRVEITDSLVLALIPPAVVAILYTAFVWFGARLIDRCRRVELAVWLCGLALSGFTWLWFAQESAPESYQLSKAAWVLYFRGSSGYYSEACDAWGDLPGYLAGYEREMAKGDVLHIGTHPPGLVILFRSLLDVCESFPWLADAVIASEPESVRAAFEALQQTALHNQNPLPRPDRAGLWLATMLLQGAAALTVIPLFGLIREGSSRRASWLAAAFWPTVPALAVFLPKSDCLYPVVACGFLWLWFTGLARPSRTFCGLAGFVFWLGMLLSLAFLPIAMIAILAALGRAPSAPAGTATADAGPGGLAGDRRRSLWNALWTGLGSCLPSAAWMLAGFSLPTVAARLFLKINLPMVWWLNFQNHAAFYRQFSRTYWKWLLVNPAEFFIAAGAPLATLAVWSVVRQWRLSGRRPMGHVGAWLAAILLLWLSGKNMGEAARLWVLLMPFLAWMAGPLFDSAAWDADATLATIPQLRLADWELLPGSAWIAALALQFATTTAIVTRVVGFHYP